MASQYVVNDRTLATKWAIKIDDGELFWEATADAASSEPIVEDETNSADNWVIFIDDGEIGIEATATEQDDDIELDDATGGVAFQLQVDDGQLRWVQTTQVVRVLVSIQINQPRNVIKSNVTGNVIKKRFLS